MDTIKVGDIAPDFTLKDQNGKEVKLSELKGQKVLLSFHPLAFTGVCARQMQDINENLDNFKSLNVVPLGFSVDAVPTKKAWAKELGIENFQLVSDFEPKGDVARILGIYNDSLGVSERVNIVVDEEGKVIFVKVYPMSEQPDFKEVLDALK